MPKKRPTPEQVGDTWRVRWTDAYGERQVQSGIPNERAAERFIDRVLAERDEIRSMTPAQRAADEAAQEDLARREEDNARRSTPFGKYAREWMPLQHVGLNTRSRRWDYLDHQILPRWNDIPLGEITWVAVERWANALEYSEETRSACVTLMSQILTSAEDEGLILSNPIRGRRRRRTPAARRAEIARRAEAENKWCSPVTSLRLARRAGPREGMKIMAQAWNGMRFEETAALHRDNALVPVSTRDGWTGTATRVCEVLAEHAGRAPDGARLPTRHEPEQDVKTIASARYVDQPPFMVDLVTAHLASHAYDRAYSTAEGRMWWRANWSTQVMRPVADGRPAARGRAGEDVWKPIQTGLTSHLLRHGQDTWLKDLGVPDHVRRARMGHDTGGGMDAVYVHITGAQRQQVLDGLQGLFDAAMAELGWTEIWPADAEMRQPRPTLPAPGLGAELPAMYVPVLQAVLDGVSETQKIADRAGLAYGVAHYRLGRLVAKGWLSRPARGRWAPPSQPSAD